MNHSHLFWLTAQFALGAFALSTTFTIEALRGTTRRNKTMVGLFFAFYQVGLTVCLFIMATRVK